MSHGCVEWAAAKAAAGGCQSSGDDFCVRAMSHHVLVAVVDGLGHGAGAAAAARLGLGLLERAATADPLALVRRCHRLLRGTRGLVMSLAVFDSRHDTMTWIGIGNVAGSLWSPATALAEPLLLRRGIVGLVLPPLQVSVLPVTAGDTLIFTTDGVQGFVDRRLFRADSLQAIANCVLRTHGTGTDDALVLVARYRGARA